MANFKRIDQLADSSSGDSEGNENTDAQGWKGSALVHSLTTRVKLFVFSYSPSHRSLISWSDNAKEILGVEDPAIIREGNVFLRHVHEDDRFLLLSELESSLRGNQPYRSTYRWIRPDNNEVRWLHCRGSLTDQPQEENVAQLFEGVILDVTEEMTGSVSKLAGPDALMNVLAAFPTVVFTLDRDLRILRMNIPEDGLRFDFGDSSFRADRFRSGCVFLDCFADDKLRGQYESTLQEILSGALSQYCTRVLNDEIVYSVEALPIVEHGVNSGILVNISDVSAVVRLETQIADLQRNEGLRLLAAGVAHNFNNALQSIIGHAAAIEHHPTDQAIVLRAAQGIQEIVLRSSELARQLTAYEDAGDSAPVPIDLNLATMAAVNRIEGLFWGGATVDVTFGTPPPVLARREHLVRAIEAVVRNAQECTPANGKISIKTSQSSLGELEVGDLPAGNYGRISVTDTGSGMSLEIRKKCLDPFFTTKAADSRSGVGLDGVVGLGLSEAVSIVRGFKGIIDIETGLGLGTAVSIYLPLDPASSINADSSTTRAAAPDQPEILVVDDDHMVLETIRALLIDLGYRVIVADGFKRAMSLAKTHQRSLRLALLDAVMPGMNGAAVLTRLKKFIPELKVIGFSGAPVEYTQSLIDAGAIEVLRKPVDLKTLKRTVQRELDQGVQAA